MADLDRYSAEAQWHVANHRGAGYAVRLQIKPTCDAESRDAANGRQKIGFGRSEAAPRSRNLWGSRCPSQGGPCSAFVLRLFREQSKGRKDGNFHRQNEVHGSAMFFVSDLLPFSRAARRGFDSRLQLHLFNNLGKPLRARTPIYSIYVTRKAVSRVSHASLRRPNAVWL